MLYKTQNPNPKKKRITQNIKRKKEEEKKRFDLLFFLINILILISPSTQIHIIL